MLPCNVIVQEREGGTVEAAAISPTASMQAVDNPEQTLKIVELAVQCRPRDHDSRRHLLH